MCTAREGGVTTRVGTLVDDMTINAEKWERRRGD